MAVPSILAVYPNDGDAGIPIGADLAITFENSIDLKSGKANVVLYGVDFDKTSGPDGAVWVDVSPKNANFLKSPGFSGIVECNYTVAYTDASGTVLDPQPTVLDRDGEALYHQKLFVSPTSIMAIETLYKAYIIGESEGGISRGVSSRTVFDVDSSGASSYTGEVLVYGGYTRLVDDVVHIKITTAGDASEAKYKWWYESEGESQARLGKVVSTRYRRLEDGLQIRFGGSGFLLNDVYTFYVYAPEYLATTYKLEFTTGTGSIVEVPATMSTSPIGVALPGTISAATGVLEILEVDPPDGATHQSLKTRTITIRFSGTLDEDTISDDSVTVYSYPISGRYGGQEVKELSKKLTVEDDTLIVEI